MLPETLNQWIGFVIGLVTIIGGFGGVLLRIGALVERFENKFKEQGARIGAMEGESTTTTTTVGMLQSSVQENNFKIIANAVEVGRLEERLKQRSETEIDVIDRLARIETQLKYLSERINK